MTRLDVNRSGELEVFVRVIELGGFSAAARAYRMTPSAVSKLVSRLEQRLGTRLIHRSTRQLKLTPEGCLFYERGVRVLADLDDAERHAGLHGMPRGRLRINSNVPFAHHFLLPLLPEFLAHYPEIKLDITLSDDVVDIVEQRTDIAIRAGELKSSSLMARKLGETPMLIVASPDYLTRCGTPLRPEELELHNRLSANYIRHLEGWPLLVDGAVLTVTPTGNTQVSDGEALRHLALSGLGLARLAAFQVKDDIAAGRLLPVLQAFNPQDTEEVHAVFVGQGGYMPLRVRALLDFLVEKVQLP